MWSCRQPVAHRSRHCSSGCSKQARSASWSSTTVGRGSASRSRRASSDWPPGGAGPRRRATPAGALPRLPGSSSSTTTCLSGPTGVARLAEDLARLQPWVAAQPGAGPRAPAARSSPDRLGAQCRRPGDGPVDLRRPRRPPRGPVGGRRLRRALPARVSRGCRPCVAADGRGLGARARHARGRASRRRRRSVGQRAQAGGQRRRRPHDRPPRARLARAGRRAPRAPARARADHGARRGRGGGGGGRPAPARRRARRRVARRDGRTRDPAHSHPGRAPPARC